MKKFQASESLKMGITLALAGGFMDAYSYLGRGGVFANAQTGNILLLGVNLAQGKFENIIRYLLPILAFICGVLFSLIVRSLSKNRKLHWRQLVLIFEAIAFMIVAFIPVKHNLLANAIISLACGMQLEAFRKVLGYPIATTMCIGNVREGTECLYLYATKKDKLKLKKGLICFGVVFFFIIGAIIGDISIKYIGLHSIIFCPALLLLGVFFMIFNNDALITTESEKNDEIRQ